MAFWKKIHYKIISSRVHNLSRAPVFAIRRIRRAEKSAEKATQEYWKKLGPGLTTGAADDDPSGIATYSQTGAKLGLHMSFMAIVTYPLMAVVQEMCARIGLVTNKGLESNIRIHYQKWL